MDTKLNQFWTANLALEQSLDSQRYLTTYPSYADITSVLYRDLSRVHDCIEGQSDILASHALEVLVSSR